DWAIELSADGHSVESLDRPQRMRINRYVAESRVGNRYRDRGARGGWRGLRARVPPKKNRRRQGRKRNPSNNEKNLPGISPGHSHPHGRSYSSLSLALKRRIYAKTRPFPAGAGAVRRTIAAFAPVDHLT